MNITWQAENYKDNFSFVHQYGEDVLNLITGDTKQFVVDLGCGNGVLTQKLSERGFRVLGIDDSSEMLAIARQRGKLSAERKSRCDLFQRRFPLD